MLTPLEVELHWDDGFDRVDMRPAIEAVTSALDQVAASACAVPSAPGPLSDAVQTALNHAIPGGTPELARDPAAPAPEETRHAG